MDDIVVVLIGCIKVYDSYSHAVYDEYPGFYDEVFKNLNLNLGK